MNGLVIRLVCGECGDAPLFPSDEGSAPYFIPFRDEGVPGSLHDGRWSIDLSDMGCPGIEHEWTSVYADHKDGDTVVRGDTSPGWEERWDAFCRRHYAAWRVDVVEPVATPQERTQAASAPLLCRNCGRTIAPCDYDRCGMGFVHLVPVGPNDHYCDNPPVHGVQIIDGVERVRFAEPDPAT